MASWALRNFAAETIFMALVICRVELTDAILTRNSFRLAIYSCIALYCRPQLFKPG